MSFEVRNQLHRLPLAALSKPVCCTGEIKMALKPDLIRRSCVLTYGKRSHEHVQEVAAP